MSRDKGDSERSLWQKIKYFHLVMTEACEIFFDANYEPNETLKD